MKQSHPVSNKDLKEHSEHVGIRTNSNKYFHVPSNVSYMYTDAIYYDEYGDDKIVEFVCRMKPTTSTTFHSGTIYFVKNKTEEHRYDRVSVVAGSTIPDDTTYYTTTLRQISKKPESYQHHAETIYFSPTKSTDARTVQEELEYIITDLNGHVTATETTQHPASVIHFAGVDDIIAPTDVQTHLEYLTRELDDLNKAVSDNRTTFDNHNIDLNAHSNGFNHNVAIHVPYTKDRDNELTENTPLLNLGDFYFRITDDTVTTYITYGGIGLDRGYDANHVTKDGENGCKYFSINLQVINPNVSDDLETSHTTECANTIDIRVYDDGTRQIHCDGKLVGATCDEPIENNDIANKSYVDRKVPEEYCHDLSKGKLLNTEAAGNASYGWRNNNIYFNESVEHFKYLRIDLLCHSAAIHTYYVYVPTFLEKLYDDGTKYSAIQVPLCNGQDGSGWYIYGCNTERVDSAYFPTDTKWTYGNAYRENERMRIYGFR